jgi:hypothetical protein
MPVDQTWQLAPARDGKARRAGRHRWRSDEARGHCGLSAGRPLLGLISCQKLRIDPTLEATVLHLGPVPLPACHCKPRAFWGGANSSPSCCWSRPNVYTGPPQEKDILALPRQDSLRLCRGHQRSTGRSSPTRHASGDYSDRLPPPSTRGQFPITEHCARVSLLYRPINRSRAVISGSSVRKSEPCSSTALKWN